MTAASDEGRLGNSAVAAKGMPSAPVKIHGMAMSASTLPVCALAAEAGLPYEVAFVDMMKGAHLTPAFRAMNPVRAPQPWNSQLELETLPAPTDAAAVAP